MTPLLVSLWLSAAVPAAETPIEPVTSTINRTEVFPQPKNARPSFVLAKGGTRRIEFVRSPTGKIQRAIVSRTDGKPMTECDAYWAAIEEEFYCDGDAPATWCQGYMHIASGYAYGEDDGTACTNARNDMCSYAIPGGCSGAGNYGFCQIINNVLCQYGGTQGGNCVYYCSSTCWSVSGNCS